MYIYYSIVGTRTLVCIVEVSVIGGVHFRRFHCMCVSTLSFTWYILYVIKCLLQ